MIATLQLYIHFPFCKRKCRYCDFFSGVYDETAVQAYCRALCEEISLRAEQLAYMPVSTVFLGGGTPSIVPAALMESVFEKLRSCFTFLPDAEITVEANPGTFAEGWLERMRGIGVNRLSLGVQAAQDELLSALGRIHSFTDAQKAVLAARAAGFDNISADLMFGLPGQTLSMYRETIDRVCDLHPSHLSAYSLILEPGTPLAAQAAKGEIMLPSDDEAADMYENGILWLNERGYPQYEISNFAEASRVCRHNVGYWQGAWYLGLGTAAHSMLPASARHKEQGAAYIRIANNSDMRAYLFACGERRLPPNEVSLIGKDEAMFETMMLGLRMNMGVGEADFLRRHGISLRKAYGTRLTSLINDGLAHWLLGGRFALTPRGLELQNDSLMRLM